MEYLNIQIYSIDIRYKEYYLLGINIYSLVQIN
jgi:hypothetical protein